MKTLFKFVGILVALFMAVVAVKTTLKTRLKLKK